MMLRRLEMIVAIDRHLNFGRAARSLGISQPSRYRTMQAGYWKSWAVAS